MSKAVKKRDPSIPEDRRDQILEAGARCICKYGLQKTNAQTIANEMGLSQTTIFYHFPKQQMIFDALFDYIVQTGRTYAAKVFGLAPQNLNQRQKLHAYLRGQLQWAEAKPHHTAVLIFSALDSAHSESTKAKVSAALDFGEETIFSILAGGMVDKEFPALDEPRQAALLIHKALIGCMIDLYLKQGEKSAADYEKAMVGHLNLLLGKEKQG